MLNLDESDTKFYDESESAFVKQVSDHVEGIYKKYKQWYKVSLKKN